jgi:hypothetical protein
MAMVAIVYKRRRARAITMQSAPSFTNPMRTMVTSTSINTMDDGYLSVLGFYEEPLSGNKPARQPRNYMQALYDGVEPRAADSDPTPLHAAQPVYDEADSDPTSLHASQAVYDEADPDPGRIPDIRYEAADPGPTPLHAAQPVYDKADPDPGRIPDIRYEAADLDPGRIPDTHYGGAVRVGTSDLYTLPRPDRHVIARIAGDEHTLQCISGVSAMYEYGSADAEVLYETLH